MPCSGGEWGWSWLGCGVLAAELVLPLGTEPGLPPGLPGLCPDDFPAVIARGLQLDPLLSTSVDYQIVAPLCSAGE